MGLLRSEDMFLYKFFVTKDNAWDVVNDLGRLSMVHFVDMNKNEQTFKLAYTEMIKRCEDCERKMSLIEQECKRFKVKMTKPTNMGEFLTSITSLSRNYKKTDRMLLEEIETDIQTKSKFVVQQSDIIKNMFEVLNNLLEYKRVVKQAGEIIH